jgi:small subunit ribosomal protein S6
MYIVDPTIGGDDEYAAIVERINTAVTNAVATLNDEEVLGPTGRRKLAYDIRHNGKDLSEGFYVLQRFRGQPNQVATIERSIKLTEPIVRYLVTLPHA